ncbi:unnamed protein product [Mytilus coruscus]|uniref:Uncharacterized protein n=1 Tax=Mytilus coruscus TaxID=42192 RepID=A0A6J8D1E4_MYTCO|nr:unnamed protein product [Mytilus coruscus]
MILFVYVCSCVILTNVKSAAGLCSNSTEELNFCNLDAGTIVGMVIGGIVAILLIVIVILLACSHIRMLENGDNLIHNLTVSTNPLGRSGQPPRYTRRTNNRNTQEPTEQPLYQSQPATVITVPSTPTTIVIPLIHCEYILDSPAGAIPGIVFGCIIFGVIVFIVVMVVCKQMKTSGNRGTVVHPTTRITTVQAPPPVPSFSNQPAGMSYPPPPGQNMAYPPPPQGQFGYPQPPPPQGLFGYAQPPPPPAYGGYGAPPPPY